MNIAVITTGRALRRWGRVKELIPDAVPVNALPLDSPEVVRMAALTGRSLPETSHRLTLAGVLGEGCTVTVLEDDVVLDVPLEEPPCDAAFRFAVHGTYLRSIPDLRSRSGVWYESGGPFIMWGAHAVTYESRFAAGMSEYLKGRGSLPDLYIGECGGPGGWLRLPLAAWQSGDAGMHGGFHFRQLRDQALTFGRLAVERSGVRS